MLLHFPLKAALHSIGKVILGAKATLDAYILPFTDTTLHPHMQQIFFLSTPQRANITPVRSDSLEVIG